MDANHATTMIMCRKDGNTSLIQNPKTDEQLNER